MRRTGRRDGNIGSGGELDAWMLLGLMLMFGLRRRRKPNALASGS
jgi:MYXO-CTERM domain-containing protein